MYDTVTEQFNEALQREGKLIYTYPEDMSFKCLFRRDSDTNAMQDRMTIYYPNNDSVQEGQLIKFKDSIYIALNKETAENEVYSKSDLLETNMTINTVSNGVESMLPCYAYDISSVMPKESTVISIASGEVELITQDSTKSRALTIDNTFTAMGATWQIVNLIYKSGIAHIYVERAASSTNTYTLSINANDSYGINTTSQLTATAKYGDSVISNATIQWTSSNTSVATIDNNGNASFLASGSVTFTALWVEHNITTTKTVSVNAYSVYITASDSYSTTDTPTLTATAKTNDTVDTTATFTWVSSDTTKATIDSTGKVAFLAAGTVTFTATWTQQNAIGTKQIMITQAVSNTADITFKATAQIYVSGSAKTFTGHFFDSTGAAITLTPVWSLTLSAAQTGHVSLVTNSNPMLTGVQADDNAPTGTSFHLNLRDSGNTCSKSISINIESMV